MTQKDETTASNYISDLDARIIALDKHRDQSREQLITYAADRKKLLKIRNDVAANAGLPENKHNGS